MSDRIEIPTVDEHDRPRGVVSMDAVLPQAASLAYRLATETDEIERHRVIVEALDTHGLTAFAIVAAAALQILAGDVLATILTAADDAGSDVRDWIPKMLEGYGPLE